MSHYHNYIVAAMDMLIGDPDIIDPEKITESTKKKADFLCIPIQYLDKLGEWRYELSSRGEASKHLIKSMGDMLAYMNSHPDNDGTFKTKNGMKIMFRNAPCADEAHSTALAISLAQQLKSDHYKKNAGSVAIMTGSDWMVAKASAAHIDVARINPEIYTGRTKVNLPLDAAPLWTKNRHISETEWLQIFPKNLLHMNEFVEFEIENYGQAQNGYNNIGRFTYDKHGNLAIIPLQYVKFSSPSYRSIRPITNVQAMYMEALLAPVDEIPIVVFSGLFGTGKTFLAIAAGLNGVGYRTSVPNTQYERIFICPRDSALGKDIGFIPGNVTEKTMAKALPIIDNVRDVIKIINDTVNPPHFEPIDDGSLALHFDDDDSTHPSSRKKNRKRIKTPKEITNTKRNTSSGSISKEVMDIIDGYFEFQPLINMGGRSISNSLIFYDEFQDVERFQARELVSRIGNGSKIVIAGDPTQLSNPHLNRTSNGLNYIANKLADKPYAAVITSDEEDEIVRHWVLREIAKDLR
ncbi:PhoH family protein [Candidatus Saccharibacteria bacterium]|nr:PhoH family protein [Candidatus Saccharibacteria bacterium]